MSPFDRRPWLRWAVPASTATLIVAGVTLAPIGAVADSPLPARTAQELLVALQEPTPTALSGTVEITTDLGLPELPLGMMPATGPLALVDGRSTVRVWADGPQRARLALIDRAAETTVVRNGTQVWVWSSAEASADRYEVPLTDPGDTVPAPESLPDGVELPSTPQEAAALVLEAVEPSTQVSTSGTATVAGRDAYELILAPRDDRTLVDRVVIAVDAETNVVLRVRVLAASIPGPAIEVGYTAVDFSAPDDDLFQFTPPPGATVTDHAAPTGVRGAGPADRARERAGADGAEPTVVGEGWGAVVVVDLPPGGLADLAEAGQRPGSGEGSPWEDTDPATLALAVLETLPEARGDWGTGRVLAGTLFSAIVTDDGRMAVGAVSPETLGAALSSIR